jgi:adenine phosphoribosyltransferase
MELSMSIQSLIRTIPNYPKPGIQFRDITTLLNNAEGFKQVVDDLAEQYQNQLVDKVVGVESRGFIIGAALAYKLGVAFVPIRKAGKLPADVIGYDYALEYGVDRMEIHADAIQQNEKILLVDDLIATGGTMLAAVQLVQKLGGDVIACAFVVDLPDLGGIKKLNEFSINTFALCAFEGE